MWEAAQVGQSRLEYGTTNELRWEIRYLLAIDCFRIYHQLTNLVHHLIWNLDLEVFVKLIHDGGDGFDVDVRYGQKHPLNVVGDLYIHGRSPSGHNLFTKNEHFQYAA